MSRFFTQRLSSLVPYVPGEQPRDMAYIKLNTNESPFPPSDRVRKAAFEEAGRLQLYSDPDCIDLRNKLAEVYSLQPEQIVAVNGSDEVLNFAFAAFGDEKDPFVFPDITYGFYPVFAALNRVPYTEIPLRDDFTIDVKDYIGIGKNIVIANPNAPTGRYLPLSEIETIVKSNPDHVVIVDEAYIDFGGESAVKLIDCYENLLVVQTFSKSRCLAGGRLGMGFGNKELIADLNTVRYSTNPYNVNRMTAASGIAALIDQSYYTENCQTVMRTRAWTTAELEKLGFTVLPSMTNFLFASCPVIDGETLYRKLKEKGILIRHFSKERIKDYNRITIGTEEQMKILLEKIKEILEENQT